MASSNLRNGKLRILKFWEPPFCGPWKIKERERIKRIFSKEPNNFFKPLPKGIFGKILKTLPKKNGPTFLKPRFKKELPG